MSTGHLFKKKKKIRYDPYQIPFNKINARWSTDLHLKKKNQQVYNLQHFCLKNKGRGLCTYTHITYPHTNTRSWR